MPEVVNQTIANVKAAFNAGKPLGLPENSVRAIICLGFMAAYLYLQWMNPKEGAVPPILIGLTGLTTGYYLTGNASVHMKAVVSLVYAASLIAFFVSFGWAPESILSQVTTVVGIYFGRKGNTPPTP